MDWGRREGGGPDRRPQGSGPVLFPAPHSEFFSRFTFPRSYAKWSSPIKCNLYYYRTNYFILITFILRKKTTKTIVSAIFLILYSAMLQILMCDLHSFAVTFDEKMKRTVKRFSPH
ncbi:unnamed protein product [Musa hybrid cultivar]